MNLRTNKSVIINYLRNFFHAQCVVTIAALPILISWGLPLSIMTLMGNLLFGPLITLFLLLSSVMFCLQLLALPTHWLAYGLDTLGDGIYTLLHFGSPNWMIGFASPPSILLWLLPCINIALLRHGAAKKFPRTWFLGSLLTANLLLLWLLGLAMQPGYLRITNKSGDLVIQKNDAGSLTLCDNGFFGRKKSAETFVQYELKPLLTKHFGTPSIEKIVLNKPSKTAQAVAAELANWYPIEHVEFGYRRT